VPIHAFILTQLTMTRISIDFLLFYFLPIGLLIAIHVYRKHKKAKHSEAIKNEEFEAGLTEPASLHPVIDPLLCMGCGSCVKACPEQASHPVLGLIRGKAQLIAPTNCIGHGACKKACPFDAITLVFGTEKRGIELPVLAPNYESSLPGIFIAGELGGMGLIRNAIEQGTKAMLSIEEVCKSGHSLDNDVVIVGAGPAGFSSTLYAKSKNMKYVTIEQESLGGTVFQFPRGKLVMTAPVDLPMVGKVKIKETTKEELLSFWENIEKESGISINYKERVVSIEPSDSGYVVNTTKGKYPTRTVLLAIGRRGTPRKLGVPGEELSKVVYRLIDPEQYVNQHVLVIGGGDSALEAALAISEQPGTTVSLSYRSEAFGRAKKKNREKIALASKSERINLLMKSNVISFDKEFVKLDYAGSEIEIPNDAALICAGGILPTGFLNEIGITVETKHGTA